MHLLALRTQPHQLHFQYLLLLQLFIINFHYLTSDPWCSSSCWARSSTYFNSSFFWYCKCRDCIFRPRLPALHVYIPVDHAAFADHLPVSAISLPTAYLPRNASFSLLAAAGHIVNFLSSTPAYLQLTLLTLTDESHRPSPDYRFLWSL